MRAVRFSGKDKVLVSRRLGDSGRCSGRVVATVLCFSTSIVIGSMSSADELSGWASDVELGFVQTDGNTETRTINAKADVTHEIDKWRNNVHLDALNTSESESTSAERYSLSGKTDYKFTSEDFLFGALTYDDDRFDAGGNDYQVSAAAGYGRTLINSDRVNLSLEVGPGYRYSKIKATNDSETEGIVRTGGKYRLTLSESAEFQQDVNVDFGKSENISKSVTALKTQIVGELAMKVSLSLRYTNKPVDNNEHMDTETALTLVYSF